MSQENKMKGFEERIQEAAQTYENNKVKIEQDFYDESTKVFEMIFSNLDDLSEKKARMSEQLQKMKDLQLQFTRKTHEVYSLFPVSTQSQSM